MEYRCTNCTMLREMAKAAIKMVTESADAYVRRDTGLAQQVMIMYNKLRKLKRA